MVDRAESRTIEQIYTAWEEVELDEVDRFFRQYPCKITAGESIFKGVITIFASSMDTEGVLHIPESHDLAQLDPILNDHTRAILHENVGGRDGHFLNIRIDNNKSKSKPFTVTLAFHEKAARFAMKLSSAINLPITPALLSDHES